MAGGFPLCDLLVLVVVEFAGVFGHLPAAHDPELRAHLVDEVLVVRNDHHASIETLREVGIRVNDTAHMEICRTLFCVNSVIYCSVTISDRRNMPAADGYLPEDERSRIFTRFPIQCLPETDNAYKIVEVSTNIPWR